MKDEGPIWTPERLDCMGCREIKQRITALSRQALVLEGIAAELMRERDHLMAAACANETHKKWARTQDDFEHAHSAVLNRSSIARTILPARRIPWSEIDAEEGE